MKATRVLEIIFLNIFLIGSIENVLITKNNMINILLMEYSRNPYKWNNKLPDFTSVILNEHLVQAMNQQQHLTDVQTVYNEAINKIYDQIPVQDLVEQFWKIYKNYDIQSFITMTRAQLALYWRYRLDKMQDPYYVLLASHCFYKIKNDVFFSRLNDATRHLVDTTIKSLPTSLQYLFGKREFCLRNDVHTEFLYQSDREKLDAETNQILTSTWFKDLTDQMGVLEPNFEKTEDDNLSDLNLALVSKHKRGYLFRSTELHNRIGANSTVTKLQNFIWSVELVNDNQLVFRQDEYLMCNEHRTLFALKDKTIYDEECQWRAGECNEKF